MKKFETKCLAGIRFAVEPSYAIDGGVYFAAGYSGSHITRKDARRIADRLNRFLAKRPKKARRSR